LKNLTKDDVSFFSAELLALIDRDFDGSQLKFIKAVGIDQSMVSRHCAGLLIPGSSTIDRLAKTLSVTQALPLVVAYLQDHCPSHLRSQVVVRAKPQSGQVQVKENLKIDLAKFPMHQRTVIQGFINIVTTDSRATELINILIKFYEKNNISSNLTDAKFD
jgi:hypothetical protein